MQNLVNHMINKPVHYHTRQALLADRHLTHKQMVIITSMQSELRNTPN